MKAKDYANRYLADRTDATLARILLEMVLESKELVRQRHARTNEALFAILDELADKWRAFTDLVGDPDIRSDGFLSFVQYRFPVIAAAWQQYREQRKAAAEGRRH